MATATKPRPRPVRCHACGCVLRSTLDMQRPCPKAGKPKRGHTVTLTEFMRLEG